MSLHFISFYNFVSPLTIILLLSIVLNNAVEQVNEYILHEFV